MKMAGNNHPNRGKLKLWLISQDANDDYDTYDSAVVAAATEQEARETGPSLTSRPFWVEKDGRGAWLSVREDGSSYEPLGGSWATPDCVTAVQIGVAMPGQERGAICASFNAG